VVNTPRHSGANCSIHILLLIIIIIIIIDNSKCPVSFKIQFLYSHCVFTTFFNSNMTTQVKKFIKLRLTHRMHGNCQIYRKDLFQNKQYNPLESHISTQQIKKIHLILSVKKNKRTRLIIE
jgi:hypothetical protein